MLPPVRVLSWRVRIDTHTQVLFHVLEAHRRLQARQRVVPSLEANLASVSSREPPRNLEVAAAHQDIEGQVPVLLIARGAQAHRIPDVP